METKPTINVGLKMSPSATIVDSLATRIPAFLRPIIAIKRPRPTEIAWRSDTGIAFMIASRSPQRTSKRIARPSIKITAIAACQSPLVIWERVKATTALTPIPEAQASGLFEKSPIQIVITPAPIHVAVIAALKGIPATTRMPGFTAMIYAIARNVVSPARNSWPTEDPRSCILKNFPITYSSPI